jgi:hypothetical protein
MVVLLCMTAVREESKSDFIVLLITSDTSGKLMNY